MSSAPPPDQQQFGLRRAAMLVIEGLLALLILFDELVRPLYRPILRWVAERRLVAQAEAAIARLPRLAILILLAVPFAIAEPLKFVGLLLIANGRVGFGAVVLAFAHLAGFLIVERIYHAGRDKLLSYRWFAWAIGLITSLRERVLAWLRGSAAYAVVMRVRDSVRRWWRARSA